MTQNAPELNITASVKYCSPSVRSKIYYARNTLSRINIPTLNLCGLKSKLALTEIIGMINSYDVICLSEIKCDEADINNVKMLKMSDAGFNIAYITRFGLSRYRSGGLLIGINNRNKLKWKMVENEYETLLTIIKVNGRMLGFDRDLLLTCVHIPPSHSRYGKPQTAL